MTGIQTKSLAAVSLVILLLVFAAVGTNAARTEDLEIKGMKYEIAGTDEETVSLALIIIVCNNSEINYKCDMWIDVLSSRGEKLGGTGIDGLSVEAKKNKEVSLKARVPKKGFSTPLKLNGTLKNEKPQK